MRRSQAEQWKLGCIALALATAASSCAGTTFSNDTIEPADASVSTAEEPEADAATKQAEEAVSPPEEADGGAPISSEENAASWEAGNPSNSGLTQDASSSAPDSGATPVETSNIAIDPQAIAGVLDGYRLEVPCGMITGPNGCAVAPESDRQVHRLTLGGDPSLWYDVDLHVRGWAEAMNYIDGEVVTEGLYLGGTPDPSRTDRPGFRLMLEQGRYYFLNQRTSLSVLTSAFNYTFTVTVLGQSLITLEVNPEPFVPDGLQRRNLAGASLPGDDLGPQPYDGQFFQLRLADVRIASDR